MRVIQGGVPVEEELAVRRLEAYAGWSPGRVDLDPADAPALGVANVDPHGISLAPGKDAGGRPALPTGRVARIVEEMARWLEHLGGRFIVFDGPDGSGKTTQFLRFAEHCRASGISVCEVREPGGTDIGEQIRDVLLRPANDAMSLRCEMMLYMASRAQLVQEKVEPALKRGELVLADRFISSTLAYQGMAGGLTSQEILQVGDVAIGHHWPDLTVVFDVDEVTAAKRMHGGAANAERTTKIRTKAPAHEPTLFSDRMERKDAEFHARVRRGFLEQAQAEPGKYLLMDASGDADSIFAALLKELRPRFS
jgi:dTMP kinase